MSKYTEVLHQTLAVSTVALNEISIGLGMGWTSPILNTQQKPGSLLTLTAEQSSWIASLEHFGKLVGVLVSALLLDTVGRKPVLVLSAIPFFLMWPALLCTKSALAICAVRFVFGLAIGLNDGANSMYLGEVSSPAIRGVFGSISITMSFFGMMAEFAIATYLSYVNVAIFNTILVFFSLLSVYWLVEPPQFLLMRGKCHQAEKNFMWLKGIANLHEESAPAASHRLEFDKMKQNVYHESQKKKGNLREQLASPANYKSVLIVLTVYVLTGAAGYFPIMSYASVTFAATDTLTPNELTVLFGIAQLAVVASTSLVNRCFDRRPVIFISFAVAAFLHSCTAALYYAQEHLFRIPYFPWLVFGTITAYASIYAFVYPTVFLIRAELFPLSIKVFGGCVSIVGMSASSFLMTKIFSYIHLYYGIYCNFLLFAFVNLVTIAFVYFVLPETKNKSLIEIQEQLEKRK